MSGWSRTLPQSENVRVVRDRDFLQFHERSSRLLVLYKQLSDRLQASKPALPLFSSSTGNAQFLHQTQGDYGPLSIRFLEADATTVLFSYSTSQGEPQACAIGFSRGHE